MCIAQTSAYEIGTLLELRLVFIRSTSAAIADAAELSGREREVLDLLARGYLYKEIAESLEISLPTVNTYIRRIYEKLHVRSRAQAVAKYAYLPFETENSRLPARK